MFFFYKLSISSIGTQWDYLLVLDLTIFKEEINGIANECLETQSYVQYLFIRIKKKQMTIPELQVTPPHQLSIGDQD